MGYGQRWPERKARPKARTLSDDEKQKLLAMMTREIASSPVLSGLGALVRAQRGRFYLERLPGEDDSNEIEPLGRITPLADSDDLLLEVEYREGSWSEVAIAKVKHSFLQFTQLPTARPQPPLEGEGETSRS